MTWPVLVFWGLLLFGLMSRSAFLIYMFFAAGAFGSLAVIPVELVGGLNLLPQPVCALALISRVILQPSNAERALQLLLRPGQLGILLLFFLIAALVTLFTPRLFAGALSVITVSGALDGPQLLGPGTYNFTQTAYLALSVATVVIFAVLAERPQMHDVFARGIVTIGAVLCATGLLGLIADAAGVSDWLAPFRTAGYVLMTDAEVLGSRRLVGLMPEASAFGGACSAWGAGLVFLRRSRQGRERHFISACALTLFVLAALSASSTAYIGLLLWIVAVPVDWCRRLAFASSSRSIVTDRVIIWLTLTAFASAAVIALSPESLTAAGDMIDALLFQKTQSASYVERMLWNQTALDALMASGGLGVGLGSARASNWFVALFSNTGLLGGALMILFLVQSLARKTQSSDANVTEFAFALKVMILINLVLGALAATSADFGVGSGALFGILAGLGASSGLALGRFRQTHVERAPT